MLLAGCASEPAGERYRVTLRGIVSFPADHKAQLADCASKRVVHLGPMVRGSYLYLRRRVREVAAHRRRPVTAEVSGYLRRSGGDLAMDRVAVLSLSPGHCTALPDRSGDIDID